MRILISTFLCLLFVFTRIGSTETVFLDDFGDGDITDGEPVSWVPAFGAGQLNVVDSSLVLTGSDSAFATLSGFIARCNPFRCIDAFTGSPS